MDLLAAYRWSLTDFAGRVGQVGFDQWAAPTPCGDWDVRTLVNHVVGEVLWSVPLLAGATLAEVGDRFSGDVLGADPAGAAREAAGAADRAVAEPGVLGRTVHLSMGDTPAPEYVHQLLAEHLVHGWDLAVALGSPPRLAPAAVHQCAVWFAQRDEMYRSGGLTDAGVPVPADANEQDRLIAAFGRDPGWRTDA
nr:TIGR03086 family metal-binding protein [Micromonospora sp. DSM 115978]